MQVKSIELVLKSMIKHCDAINNAHEMFNNNKTEFLNNSVYQNSVLFSLLQIGELITHINIKFREQHTEIPWNQIKATRNIIVHGYDQLNIDLIWNTSQTDIEEFRNFCTQNVQSEYVYKEITPDQLSVIKQTDINIEIKESQRKIIIKYNVKDEAKIKAVINPKDSGMKI